jgi:hypothetical protein
MADWQAKWHGGRRARCRHCSNRRCNRPHPTKLSSSPTMADRRKGVSLPLSALHFCTVSNATRAGLRTVPPLESVLLAAGSPKARIADLSSGRGGGSLAQGPESAYSKVPHGRRDWDGDLVPTAWVPHGRCCRRKGPQGTHTEEAESRSTTSAIF